MLRDLILRRLNNLRFLKASHEIVKYGPQYYDENGAYQKDEWTYPLIQPLLIKEAARRGF